MSIDFTKNEAQLIAARKDVLNDTSKTNWAVFGYENETNALEVVSTGTDGYEGLIDEMDETRMLYGFLRVECAGNLPAYCIIDWKGDAVHPSKRSSCYNHILPVTKFLGLSHLTIRASNEDDLDESYIRAQLDKVLSSKQWVKPSEPDEQIAPVGTNYKRVMPEKEINVPEREVFWIKEREEEKLRKMEEKKKSEENKKKIEQEIINRELINNKEREAKLEEKYNELEKNKQKENITLDLKINESREYDSENEKKKEREIIRKQKLEEEAKLKNMSVVSNTKAIFEHGQPQYVKPSRNDLILTSEKEVKSRDEVLWEVNELNRQLDIEIEESKRDKYRNKISSVIKKSLKLKKDIFQLASEFTKIDEYLIKNKLESLQIGENIPSIQKDLDYHESLRTGLLRAINSFEIAFECVKEFQSIKAALKTTHFEDDNKEDNQNLVKNEINDDNESKKDNKEAIKYEQITEQYEEEVEEEDDDDDEEEKVSQKRDDINQRKQYMIEKSNYQTEREYDDENWQDYDAINDPSLFYTVKCSYAEPLEDIAEETEESIEENNEHKNRKSQNSPKHDYGLRARALFDYQAGDDNEISFDPDDIITNIEQIHEGWWQGLGPDGAFGLFPSNYVELLDD